MANTEYETEKECEMSDVKNYFATTPYAAPVAAAPYGGGFGLGGGDGGLLALALLGGGGLGFGGRRDHDRNDCASTDQLQTATGSIVDTVQNQSIQNTLASISAAIPLAEAQVQLSVAGAVGEIRSHLGQVENTLVQGQTAINKNISDAIASSLASQNSINVNVLTQGSATREAINAMGVANLTATANSTKEILAAINDTNMANLQRQLAVAENALLETRAESRARGTEVTVTQTVNQNQLQLQAQQQQQQLVNTVTGLCHLVGNLQSAVATNSNMIIGNAGATTTGAQTANPINVRT